MLKLLRKAFWVPYDDGSIYPTLPRVIKAISDYCAQSNEEFTFIADDKVIINNITYEIYTGQDNGSRGSYGIKCTQIKEK